MKKLEISLLRLDGGTQPRAELNHDVVTEYADAMKSGAIFPPITIFFDGAEYWLADGFHRLQASKNLALSVISVDILQGSLRDAVLYSTGANATHGLRRSNEDKRKAVMTLLLDHEWNQWSDREIARKAGVSDRFTNKLRSELLTANNSQSNLRKGVDGRIINTANIGKGKKSSKTPSSPETSRINLYKEDKSQFAEYTLIDNSNPVIPHQTKAKKRAEKLEPSGIQPLTSDSPSLLPITDLNTESEDGQRAENAIVDIFAITILDDPPQVIPPKFSLGDQVRILRRQEGEDKWTGCTAIIWEVTPNGWIRVDVEEYKGVKFTLKPEWVELMEKIKIKMTETQDHNQPDAMQLKYKLSNDSDTPETFVISSPSFTAQVKCTPSKMIAILDQLKTNPQSVSGL